MLFTFPWCFILTCNTHITVWVNVITIFPLASPGYKITVWCACACHWPQAEIVKSALVRVCVHECVHVCAHVYVWLPPNGYHESLCELIDRFLRYTRVLKWPSHCASYNPCFVEVNRPCTCISFIFFFFNINFVCLFFCLIWSEIMS